MLLGELMKDHTPSIDYKGWVTNDDYVLAVALTQEETDPNNFAVVGMGVTGLDENLNPETSDKTYWRAGKSSQKTAQQQSFKPAGDRYIGDPFQDMAFSHDIKFGTGNAVVRKFVYFNILAGDGNQGSISIIVNTSAGGAMGESSAFDVDLKGIGAKPDKYVYTPTVLK